MDHHVSCCVVDNSCASASCNASGSGSGGNGVSDIVILFWWSPFIPSRNLDEVFTYNHMA